MSTQNYIKIVNERNNDTFEVSTIDADCTWVSTHEPEFKIDYTVGGVPKVHHLEQRLVLEVTIKEHSGRYYDLYENFYKDSESNYFVVTLDKAPDGETATSFAMVFGSMPRFTNKRTTGGEFSFALIQVNYVSI